MGSGNGFGIVLYRMDSDSTYHTIQQVRKEYCWNIGVQPISERYHKQDLNQWDCILNVMKKNYIISGLVQDLHEQ
jgi:hypothetical protein